MQFKNNYIKKCRDRKNIKFILFIFVDKDFLFEVMNCDRL